ncbi:MAG: hypothetical protein A4E63_00445 [Syntrophorhabdus sp. PtaU1.Bin050]|nr:MAG: hypothetical protein A4E63_00445 [Syntrophorhabdus sp. PtaU1.Bin050]
MRSNFGRLPKRSGLGICNDHILLVFPFVQRVDFFCAVRNKHDTSYTFQGILTAAILLELKVGK